MEAKKVIYTKLDTDLIPTTNKIITSWHVLTGTACCGKTRTIDLLAERGFQIAAETTRLVIDQELNKGKHLEEIIGQAPLEKELLKCKPN